MDSTYADTRRMSEQMLARTDTLLTMALSLLGTASDDLRAGWHHVVAVDLDAAAANIRAQRAIIRSRLVSGFDDPRE